MESLATVVPRWEWRAFANTFGDVDDRIRAQASEIRSSAETYVLCRDSDANVKIRHGVLDVKRLQRAEHGLELWSPILKVAFPIDAGTIAAVFAEWGLVPPETGSRALTMDEFLSDVVAPTTALRAVAVQKERHGALIGGCAVEVAALLVDGRPIRTIGVEAEAADLVRRTVHTLGLSAFRNLNYVTALKELTGIAATSPYHRAPGGRLS
ncbi:MAG: hypothetical protein IT184_08345 [Acidobacteria bacterium]|nr:hypothetical protein [Acidobacteriota bacterium]